MILRLSTKSSNALVFVPKMREKLALETMSGSGGSMFMKHDAAAEQSCTTRRIQMQRRAHHSQPPGFVLKLSGW